MLPGRPGLGTKLPPPRRRRRLRGYGGDGGGAAAARRVRPLAPPCTGYDVAYFKAYAALGVHEEMLKDHVRTECYRSAIMQHQNFITDKVVIDVGCGTGVLSIFCARAGARRVYAVDASEIAIQAMHVVEDNNLSGKVIVLHGRIEDVEIKEMVDVIISEWMGYMLLHEGMLGSIIFARDKWLKPGGLILPSHASLYMAPVTNSERYRESIDFWHNVYGIKMSAFIPTAKLTEFDEPSVETIKGENVLTWPSRITEVDCYTVRVHELKTVTAKYKFSSMLQAPLHGFAFWFDAEFNGPELPVPNYNQLISGGLLQDQHQHSSGHLKKRPKSEADEAVILSTAPEDAPTHWQQTLVYMFNPIQLEEGQIVEGLVTISQREQNFRSLNISLEFNSGGQSFVKVSVMR